jgi:hypothetical protein
VHFERSRIGSPCSHVIGSWEAISPASMWSPVPSSG